MPIGVSYSEGMTFVEVEVNRQGRVTIPVEIRRHLGLHEGSRLVAREEDGRIVLEQRAHLLSRIQDRLAAEARTVGYGPGGVVDELIASRRAEAAREDSA